MVYDSLNWQHQLCKNPRPNPDIKTLFIDHTCGQQNGARAPSPVTNSLMGPSPIPKTGPFPPLGAHGVSYALQFFKVYVCCSLLRVQNGDGYLFLLCSPFSLVQRLFLCLLRDGWRILHQYITPQLLQDP